MRFSSLRGMQDIIEEIHLWQHIENNVREIFENYNFQEIRTPILEKAEIFLRSIGENTDIVEKEMYIFNDKKGRTVALRPEGTASVVRAYIQHGLFNNPAPQKFYYIGPMFRYERPQKGRLRQFHQIGVECFGVSSSFIDAELIYMLKIFLEKLKIKNLAYEINSLGCKECRAQYRKILFNFLSNRVSRLCDDCKRRFERNPLRVLDCKVESCKEALKDIPLILEFLCSDCKAHFLSLQKELDEMGISYTVNPKIVRGLDYYTRTVFEVTTTMLGAQNAVAAGGRYDDLVESFGGPPTPAIGFAIGIERLIELCSTTLTVNPKRPIVYVAYLGNDLRTEAKKVVNFLRENNIPTEISYEETSLKSQMRKADKFGVKIVIIIGEDEIKKGVYKWKNMQTGLQGECSFQELIDLIRRHNDQS
ncbi:histidine--tRNA ligase [Thermodesulfovibrio sp.]|uniref:Histidine--tRNA ligase n=2 Tax=Thermodesulfovibrio TaxID=28261 RepID=A0A2J6WL56_9BACT|nr:MAG: histidine--tRNA ligase [Thermodesulfovibrio aggregans]